MPDLLSELHVRAPELLRVVQEQLRDGDDRVPLHGDADTRVLHRGEEVAVALEDVEVRGEDAVDERVQPRRGDYLGGSCVYIR